MKFLTVVFLLASAATASLAASPYTLSNFCPTGELVNSHNTITLSTAGTSYYASQCSVAEGALVTLYAETAPKLTGSQAAAGADTTPSRITASFEGGVFNASSQILICMPLKANMATTVPIHVYVQDNYFHTNAVIRFYGSYPPNSQIVITGNTIEPSSEPSTYPTMTTQIAGILGWQSNKDFYMGANSKIEISSNIVSVTATNRNYEARGIGIWNYVYMQANASVSMNSNTINVIGIKGKFNGGMDAFAYIAEGPNTQYEMINNNLTVSNGFAIGCPYARYPTSSAEEMRYPTKVLVSRNSGQINAAVYFPTSKSDGDVIFVGNSKNSLTSSIEISHNVFNVEGSDGNIRVAQTELRDTAEVRVLANTLTTRSGAPRIIFSWNMSAYDDSRVYAMHNTLLRVDELDNFPASFFLYYRGYNLYNNSESHYSYNTFGAVSAAKKAYLLERYPEMPFFVHNDSAFKMCGNSYYDSVLSSDEAVDAALPAYVVPYVASQDTCPAEPFPFPEKPAVPAQVGTYDALTDETHGVDDGLQTSLPATTEPTVAPTYQNGAAGATTGVFLMKVALLAMLTVVLSSCFGA